MARKLLTFLGTNDYEVVYHKYSNDIKGPHNFIQESLIDFFCEDWNDKDSVVVVMTSRSRDKNWVGEDKLERKLDSFKNKLNIVPLLIPEGKEENELWTIFSTIFDSIEAGDEIILDITHSFRSLPFLSLIILNYARTIKQVIFEKILYAALDALGSLKDIKNMSLEDRIVPIFDLTPFVTLFDWTIAVDRFLETGNAVKIKDLSLKELGDVLSESKGKIGGNVRNLTKNLAKYTKVMYTCRGPEIKNSIEAVQENVKK